VCEDILFQEVENKPLEIALDVKKPYTPTLGLLGEGWVDDLEALNVLS
jgi:hypothetical protein